MFRAATLALLLSLGLAACGFQPLYASRGTGPDTSELLAQVEVTRIADRTGQQLRNELLDRMNPGGRTATPRYRLRVTLSESTRRLAIRRDDTATLASLIISASFSLVSVADGEIVMSGTLRSLNSFDISRSDFATVSAERDARERATIDLADGITARVSVFLANIG